jgi:hypothetical protein
MNNIFYHSPCVRKIFFISDIWIWSLVDIRLFGFMISNVCKRYFTIPVLYRWTPKATLFSLCKEFVFPSCTCIIFFFVLILQEFYKICQVYVFPHHCSLELSESSPSADSGLFPSQTNYLLLFNYSLSSICSILSLWNAYHFYKFPGSILQPLYCPSVFWSP